MSNSTITMNGDTYNPSSVDFSLPKIGEARRMADGTQRFYFVTNKRQWVLKWNTLNETNIQFTRLSQLATLQGVFTFRDHNGVDHQVLVLPDNYTESLVAEKVGRDGVKRYDISLTLTEV